MKQKCPHYKKIFKSEPKESDFVDAICKVDSLLSKFAKYISQYYTNGEQSLFYKYKNVVITVTIAEEEEY